MFINTPIVHDCDCEKVMWPNLEVIFNALTRRKGMTIATEFGLFDIDTLRRVDDVAFEFLFEGVLINEQKRVTVRYNYQTENISLE